MAAFSESFFIISWSFSTLLSLYFKLLPLWAKELMRLSFLAVFKYMFAVVLTLISLMLSYIFIFVQISNVRSSRWQAVTDPNHGFYVEGFKTKRRKNVGTVSFDNFSRSHTKYRCTVISQRTRNHLHRSEESKQVALFPFARDVTDINVSTPSAQGLDYQYSDSEDHPIPAIHVSSLFPVWTAKEWR